MKQAKVLSKSELQRVLAVVAAGKHAERNRIAIMLSHYAGLRVGEIASLRWKQLLEADGSIKMVFYLDPTDTKCNEARAVHLNPLLVRELSKFKLTLSAWQLQGPVITSQKGSAFSGNSLCQLFGRIYTAAGISGASSHSGRRWFITQLAHSGVSPKVIMELAGHKNLGTTQRYIEVNEQMKQRAVSLLN
ncbi:MAG: site-specific integrase [Rhizobiaceae bacterium]